MPEVLLPYQRKWIEDDSKLKLWLASRQVGKSFTLALDAVQGALRVKGDKIILSASERQSKEVMEKVLSHIRFIETVLSSKPDQSGKKIQVKLLMAGGIEEATLINGSRIISLPSNPDTVRGFTGDIFLDEFAFHQNCIEIWRAIYPAVTRGFRVSIASTPNGRNLFWDLYNNSNFSKHIVTIEDAKNQGLNTDIEAIKSNMDEDSFNREYMCSFEVSAVGAYYSKEIKQAEIEGRVSNVPHEKALPVFTFWDLGVGDSTGIWFAQRAGMEVRCIDYYENSGEGLPHYIKVLADKGYIYGGHFAPHDIKVRELGSGKARIDTAKALGIDFKIVTNISIEDGIHAVRNLLPKVWFDKTKCKRGLEALKNYRKEWDNKREEFKNKPYHDWASNGADAMRYMAVSEDKAVIRPKPKTVSEIMTRRPYSGMAIWA